MSDSIKRLVRVISVEKFGNPETWKLVGRVTGTKELTTVTLQVEPRFTPGEEITIALG